MILIEVKQTKQKYYRYAVYKLSSIKKLIELFNGNFLLKKTFQRFKNWVQCYNALCDQWEILKQKIDIPWPSERIIIKQPNVQFDLDSAWLTGFTDAEGCFYASLSPSKRHLLGLRLRVKYYIRQKDELSILKEIDKQIAFRALAKMSSKEQEKQLRNREKLQEDGRVKKISKKKNTYGLEITHLRHLEELVDYFDTYPLLTKKKIMYVRWKRIICKRDLLKERTLVSEKSLRRYKTLVAAVGKIRQTYNL